MRAAYLSSVTDSVARIAAVAIKIVIARGWRKAGVTGVLDGSM